MLAARGMSVLRGAISFQARPMSAIASNFDAMVQSLPMREAIRYKKKNMKWQSTDIKKYVDAQANAFVEYGLEAGDTIAVWLPESAEKHVTQIAAAKVGLLFADLDLNISSVEEVRSALSLTQPRAIIFEPESATQNNLNLLRRAIPEFYHYDDSSGKIFHSKYYPNLKYFIHTGFDIEIGCINYKHVFLPNPEINRLLQIQAAIPDSAPLYTSVKKENDGKITQTPALTHAQVLEQNTWPSVNKLLAKEYFEV